MFVAAFICSHFRLFSNKTVTAVILKLSEQTGNDSEIMPLNSPGGSTLQ